MAEPKKQQAPQQKSKRPGASAGGTGRTKAGKEMKRQTWGRRRRPRERRESAYERKVVSIRRVAKARSGARRLRFSAVVVVGNERGKVGVGLGRGKDTRMAVDKGAKAAEKNMVSIPLINGTIPHEITHKKGAAKVFMKPALPGTGIIAGSSIRAILELSGVKNVLTKILGSSNQVNNAYCAFEALQKMKATRLGQVSKPRVKVKVPRKTK